MDQTTISGKRAGTRRSRNELVLAHIDYVNRICARIAAHVPSSIDVANLNAAGIVGLVEAAHRYDESLGTAFKTFSYPRIRGAIIDELRRNSHVSQRILSSIRRLREAGDEPDARVSPESLGAATGLSLREINECRRAMKLENPASLNEAIAVDGGEPPDAQLQRAEQKQMLANAIERLPMRERLVIQMYYREEFRLRDIGRVLGISESRVSRILTQAESRLRRAVSKYEA